MDFITGFPMTSRHHDSVMVVVDKLTKASHYIPVKSTYKASDIAQVFMKKFFRLHGLPKVINSNQDVKFTSNFWKGLFQELGTQLNFSTTYHSQMNGQTERVNQELEDMLCMYVMDKPTKWEDYLHLGQSSHITMDIKQP